MRKLKSWLLFSLLFIPFGLSATNYYVATTGSDSNTGTSISSPFLTVAKAVTKATVAGDSIIIRSGTYASTATLKLTKSGTSAKHLVITAYRPDITSASKRPILDFSGMSVGSSNQGCTVSGVAYCDIYGLIFKGAGDNGMLVQSTSNNMKFEFCSFTQNRDAGFLIRDQSHDCLILNCDAFANADMGTGTTTLGGNADGFSPKLDPGSNIIFRNCRSWKNSDDGWDGYLKCTEAGIPTGMLTILENCWAWGNGYYWKDGTTNSSMNGNGIKMGGSANKDQDHNFRVINCLSFDNKAKGFDQNNNAGSMYLYNCTSYGNGDLDYGLNSSGVTYVSGAVTSVINSICTSGKGTAFKSGATLTTNSFTAATSNFSSIDTTGMSAQRKVDGSLPDINFAHLASGSALIDAGTIQSTVAYNGGTGIPYSGTKPDLGCFETVSNPTLVLTSGSSTQSATSGVAITSIVYTYGGTATGANVTGLPTGITATPNTTAKTVTISGSSTVVGSANFTITTTQASGTATSLTGTITIVAAITPTLVLTSGSATQTAYVGSAISNIVYTYGGGATGATVTGLPTGVSATTNVTTKTVTISGTPTTTSTGSYSIVTTGGTGSAVTLSGTITVNNPTTLSAPGSVTATNTTTSITLNWPAISNASSYMVNLCSTGTSTTLATWDFTDTWTISSASADANLVVDASNVNRFNYIPATTNTALLFANGTAIPDVAGLLFTQTGASKVRLGFGTSLLYLNGTGISVSIPCSVGNVVTIIGPSGNATAIDRGYTATGGTLNTTKSSNIDATGIMNVAGAVGTWVYTATATKVVITSVIGGMNIQKITVSTSGSSTTCTEYPAATNTYTASGLTNGATYTYQVKALSSNAAYTTSSYTTAQSITTGTVTDITKISTDFGLIQTENALLVTGIDVDLLSIYNLQGQIIASAKDSSINISSLNHGVYVVLVKGTDGSQSSKKFIK